MSDWSHDHVAAAPPPSRSERLYLGLAGLFIGSLVMTNLIAGKFFVFAGLSLSCGVIAYPVTFLATDLISEIWGRKRANQVVVTGFLVSLFVTAVIYLAVRAPIDPNSYLKQDEYQKVFGLVPGLVFGSMCAYLTAQFLDIRVFEFWRNLTQGRHLWLRNNGSTVVSQLVDTTLVVTISLVAWPLLTGLGDPIDGATWRRYVLHGWLFKASVAFLDTPLFYLGVAWIRKRLD